jgi:hypothetical protein
MLGVLVVRDLVHEAPEALRVDQSVREEPAGVTKVLLESTHDLRQQAGALD